MNAPRVSAKELFVLGRLSMRPTHGHEIMRTLAESRADLWVELSEKHVYYILKKLEGNGLVRVEEHSEGGRPTRRVFSLTSAGLREFDRLMHADGLIESISYSDFDVCIRHARLHRSPDRRREDRRACAPCRAPAWDHRCSERGTRSSRSGQRSVLPSRVFQKVIRVADAELGWLQEVLTDIERDGWPARATRHDARFPRRSNVVSPTLIGAVVTIRTAAGLYTIAVFAGFRSGELKPWHLALFWSGLVFDTIGTTLMRQIAGGFELNIGGALGVLAIAIMLVHAAWATIVLLLKRRTAVAQLPPLQPHGVDALDDLARNRVRDCDSGDGVDRGRRLPIHGTSSSRSLRIHSGPIPYWVSGSRCLRRHDEGDAQMSYERTDRAAQKRSRVLRWSVLGVVLVGTTGISSTHPRE